MSDERDAVLKKLIEKWHEGWKRAEGRHARAVKFLLNNEVRLVRMLTTDRDDDAEDHLHDLRIDWYSQEGSDA